MVLEIKKSNSSALVAELLHPVNSELRAINVDRFLLTDVCRAS